MFKITPRTRIQEGASWEDIQDGDCYETGYEICDIDGEIIYDFAGEHTKNYYEDLNRKEEENTMKKTNAIAKLNKSNLTNTAMLRKEVVEYAEKNDVEYGHCMTCKHYQKLDICSNCYNGSRYCFAWKEYLENHKDEMIKE